MNQPRIRFTRIGLISAVLSFAGCASTLSSVNEVNPYPPSWPRIESQTTDSGCPILQGHYNNQSVTDSFGSDFYIDSLAEVMQRATAAGRRIWPGSEYVTLPPNILAVSLYQDQDSMSVEFHESSGKSATIRFHRFRWTSGREFENIQKFYCEQMPEGPVLRLMATVDRTGGASTLGAGGQDTIVWLYKSVDGSLVVRWQVQTVETSLIVVGSSLRNRSVWLRFQPVKLAAIGVQ